MGVEQLERIHERRTQYERLVLREFPRAFGRHDAEDIVSTAMHRAMTAGTGPRDGSEDSWFLKLLFNAARDEIRRREGRRFDGSGGWRHTIPASFLPTDPLADDPNQADEYDALVERLDEDVDREQSRRIARRALAELDPDDARLLLLRHSTLANATRADCATAAGLTLAGWRNGYRRAWRQFVHAVSIDEPTPRCQEMRELAGELDVGTSDAAEAAVARGRLDAHVIECASCHAFLRTSYRILTPESLGTGGVIAAGAGVAAAGFGAWVAGAGGLSGIAATICVLSVTTAGICGGVFAILDRDADAPRQPPTVAAATPSPRPSTTVTPTATVAPRATTTPAARRSRDSTTSRARRTNRTASRGQPAAAPSGGQGTEFAPEAQDSQSVPAPVASGVSGEFAP